MRLLIERSSRMRESMVRSQIGVLFFLVFVSLFFSGCATASSQNETGPVRGFLRERLSNRLKSEPAPVVDVSDLKSISKRGLSAGVLEIRSATAADSLKRYYKIYIPKAQDLKNAPVIFALHGGGGDMNIKSEDQYYGLISGAEKYKAIVVFPNGYSNFASGRLATWNAGACCGDARDKNINDVGFLKELAEQLKKNPLVNSERFFVVGMSNGGMMAYHLACQTSGVFKAVASVTGTDNQLECESKTSIPVLHIHAKDDDHVRFEGGIGSGAFEDKSKITEFKSVDQTIEKWKKLNQCDNSEKVFLKVSGAECKEWSSCQTKKPVQLCVTDTGGHSWPGGEKPARRFKKTQPTSKAISATEEVFKFFLKF